MEGTRQELVVGGDVGIGEVSGSAFSRMEEAGEKVTARATPDVRARLPRVAKASYRSNGGRCTQLDYSQRLQN
jgi:hypothetical protein